MSVSDRKLLRSAFGSFITGVTVVTASDAEGMPSGFTANSYTSVSLDPPLLLVCPARSLSSFDVFWARWGLILRLFISGTRVAIIQNVMTMLKTATAMTGCKMAIASKISLLGIPAVGRF